MISSVGHQTIGGRFKDSQSVIYLERTDWLKENISSSVWQKENLNFNTNWTIENPYLENVSLREENENLLLTENGERLLIEQSYFSNWVKEELIDNSLENLFTEEGQLLLV